MKYYGESERAYHRSMRRAKWERLGEIIAKALAGLIILYFFCTL
jgi:hypothetical protein